MTIKPIRELDRQIVVIGMSCSGKTTFAQQTGLPYLCFDAMFPWHQIETFGMSISVSIDRVAASCKSEFILDGWHTSDLKGERLPQCVVYVVYTEYERILQQYPRQALHHLEYFPMFRKWYSYSNPEARYFYNQGDFIETDFQSYVDFISRELETNQS